MYQLLVLSLGLLVGREVAGHGRLIDPPSRSSCWRYGFEGCVKNYNDMELFCGGFGRQWNDVNKGRCGVCGDMWSLPQPRENEAGGKYGKGVIVDSYSAGQTIVVKVDLTTPHLGWFEFRLCKNDDVTKIITHDCLNENLLTQPDGKTRYYPGSLKAIHEVSLKLPSGLTCTQCVLQWKYNTGNTWNCDEDKNCCKGCGPQEQFYGCADIEIKQN